MNTYYVYLHSQMAPVSVQACNWTLVKTGEILFYNNQGSRTAYFNGVSYVVEKF